MKKLYEVVYLDVIRFDTEDVLSTSGDPEPCNPDKFPPFCLSDASCPNNCPLAICEREICQLECALQIIQ